MELCRKVGKSFDGVRSISSTNDLYDEVFEVSVLNQMVHIPNLRVIYIREF